MNVKICLLFCCALGQSRKVRSARLAMMRVRAATEADRHQLITLVEGYFKFYETTFPGPSRIDALLDAVASDERLGVHLVAEEGRSLLGFASLYSCFDTLVADRILVMNDLFVAPESRGAGVGAVLFNAARQYAEKTGYVRLDWVTAIDNQGAQRFYDRHGGQRGPWVSYSLPVR
jgi:GNAT superfamily N-acetyltransferase